MMGGKKQLFLLCLACLCLVSQAAQIVRLDTQQWRLTNANGTISLPTTVPNYPLEVLRVNGIIQDPNYRFGELESRWVALDTWTFTLNFMGNESGVAEALQKQQVLLQLGGIDTFGTVTLNNQLLLETNNFHRSWAVPVKNVLSPGLNILAITISPAAPETVSLKAKHPYSIPSLQQLGSIGAYVFARKPASDFGWDWGPAYAASGIHGFVNLLAYETATLTSAFVAQNLITAKDGNKFAINITSQFVVPTAGDKGTLKVEIPELGISEKRELLLADKDTSTGVKLKRGSGGMLFATVSTKITVDENAVELWWPVGYGKQFMYDVVISFTPETMRDACAIADDKGSPANRKLLQTFIAAAAEASDYMSEQPVSMDDTFVAGVAALPAACAVAVRDGSVFKRRIGFRTVELVRLPIGEAVKDLFPAGEKGWDPNADFYQQKDNSDGHWAQTKDGIWKHFEKTANQSNIEGESFYFKVNNIPIYMKGANYIPSHIIHTQASNQILNDTMQYALESNMNMIRVWGGGRYPVANLFNFADEHGILIWMETMFACAPYPRDPDFLNNVAAEVTQQVQRLSWNPSVAIWGGNNEIEGSLNWYAESRSNRAMFANDYQALFIDTIRREIRAIIPTMPFVDSSPSNGVIADNDREYVKRWGDDWDWRYGDVHWYAYESDCEDWTTYPKSKFISEFGSQSYPTFATYAEATAPEDWQVDNFMTGFRNRRFGNGLEMFEAQFKRHFRLPASWKAPSDPEKALKLFKSFFYITHMQQARCYEAAINYWRRLRSHPAGLTMGVLYWQLNDIAQFASWSSYDYGGRWKPLAYSVKRMYAPLQVQAFQDGANVRVFLVNDRVTPVMTTVYVSLLSLDQNSTSCPANRGWHSFGVAPVLRTDYQVLPNFASEVWSTRLAALLRTRPGCTEKTCYIQVTAVAKPNQPGAGEVSETQLWLVPLKDITFPDPEMRLSNFRVGLPDTVGTAALPGRRRPAGRQLRAKDDEVDTGVEEAAIQAHRSSKKKTEEKELLATNDRISSGAPEPVVTKPVPKSKGRFDAVHGGSSIVPKRQAGAPGTPITFTLSATRTAALTNLLTKYRGRFSDDAFNALHPCTPKTITFYPHVSAGSITAEDLAADLKVESLFDHQYDVAAAKKGGRSQPTVAAAAAAVGPKPSQASTAAILNIEKKRHAPN